MRLAALYLLFFFFLPSPLLLPVSSGLADGTDGLGSGCCFSGGFWFMSNNAELMYKYAEKEVESFDKSIDTITSKLTSILAFSGVMMKFASDLCGSQIKIAVTSFVAIAIVSAIIGLFPKDRGEAIRCHAFMGNDHTWYNGPAEEFQLRIIQQWVIHISKLEELLDFRAFWFKISLTSLSVAALLFAVVN